MNIQFLIKRSKRTAVCRGEAFDKNKYRVQSGELVDVLAVEKRNGIRLLCFKPDTIR